MSQTVADVVVSVLTDAGVKRCYGLPGDTLNHVTDALRRGGAIRFVHVRHEEVGGFAAGADAMITGDLTMCAGSCGPGSLHFINGLYDAHRSRCPVVLIASQIARGEIGFDFPQEVDFKAVYDDIAVFCEEVRTPECARRVTAAAAQAALSQRGVAVVILPADVAAAKAPDQPAFAVHRAAPSIVPAPSEIEAIAKIVNAGEKIAIYGGSGCRDAKAEVMALAERLGAPVAYTSRAKDFLEPDNPYTVGMTGVFGVSSGYDALVSCDTLILLGCDFAWRQFYPSAAKIVQVDIDGRHLGRRHPVDLGVVGDVRSTIQALLPHLSPREAGPFLTKALADHEAAYAKLMQRAVPADGPIRPQYLTSLIAKHADADAVFTADGGSPMVWLLRHIPATGQNRTIVSLTHGTMAAAMPNALGVAAACPGRQVISLSGDGGLAMLLGDLLTTIQEQLPIKIVVFNNSSLAFVEIEQKVEGLLDTYTDLKNPDFGRVAEAIGLWGRQVSEASLLDVAVQEWLNVPGPALLDVIVDRQELVMPPHVAISQVMGTAMYSAKALLAGRFDDVVEITKHGLASL